MRETERRLMMELQDEERRLNEEENSEEVEEETPGVDMVAEEETPGDDRVAEEETPGDDRVAEEEMQAEGSSKRETEAAKKIAGTPSGSKKGRKKRMQQAVEKKKGKVCFLVLSVLLGLHESIQTGSGAWQPSSASKDHR